MNIYLEAFVDTNFGDNLFVHTVAVRYPQCTFYMLERKGYEESYRAIHEQEKNIIIVPAAEGDAFLSEMDAMMLVGGDIFGEYTDYVTLITRVHRIKKQRGYVFFLGFSLMETYTARSGYYLKHLFTLADMAVVRERQSAEQVKQIAPGVSVVAAADMAFTLPGKVYTEDADEGVLGVSVRKKISGNADEIYPRYCEQVKNTIIGYLDEDEKHLVRFLAFSKGIYDDEEVAGDIIKMCPESYRERIQSVVFDGDVDSFIEEVQRCGTLLCTRFHGVVLALLLHKPFVPIVYEEKTKRLLNEIGYTGIAPRYEEVWEVNVVREGLRREDVSEERLISYLKQADKFFENVDRIINNKKMAPKSNVLLKKIEFWSYKLKCKFLS